MEVVIQTVPHRKQRYDTSGDYYFSKGKWTISVSEELEEEIPSVAIHELCELVCIEGKVTEQEVTVWDILFNRNKRNGAIPCNIEEPGDCPFAPYHEQHVIATHVEELILTYLRGNHADIGGTNSSSQLPALCNSVSSRLCGKNWKLQLG